LAKSCLPASNSQGLCTEAAFCFCALLLICSFNYGDMCSIIVLFCNYIQHVIVVGTIYTTYLHIDMILSTLSLNPHGFALGLYPKCLIPMEIFVHPYIPMILPISSQCGTLVVYPTIVYPIVANNRKR
jgi:hypothetical protein